MAASLAFTLTIQPSPSKCSNTTQQAASKHQNTLKTRFRVFLSSFKTSNRMDLALIDWLQSAEVARLLNELTASDLSAQTVLNQVQQLGQRYGGERARALVEQTLLRQRAAHRFPNAAQLFFEREALEQASNATVAHHRAQRFAGYAQVGDICCGLGSDMLALAQVVPHVIAIDRDPLRLALARANARVCNLEHRIEYVQADLTQQPPPALPALFCDPSRRQDGHRRFRIAAYEPPVSQVLSWQHRTPALAIKLSPGITHEDLAYLEAEKEREIEFVSVRGELCEAVVWCGPLATTRRRATVLESWSPDNQNHAVVTLVQDTTVPALTVSERNRCSMNPTRPSSVPVCWLNWAYSLAQTNSTPKLPI